MSLAMLGPVVMRRSSSGAVRLPRVALSGPRTTIYPSQRSSVRPSIVPSQPVEFDTSPFGACGRWMEHTVLVPKAEAKEHLAYYLANHSGPRDAAWTSAEQRFPTSFRSYRPFQLFERTLVLPAGPVVFQVEELPLGTLPDSPPEHIYGLVSKAILLHRTADFRLLTPVFDVPPVLEEPVRLATPIQLLAMQLHARKEVEAQAKRWGFLYRYRAWSEMQAKARAEAQLAEAQAKEQRRQAREAAEILALARPERLSPTLLALQERVQADLRSSRRRREPLLNLGELDQVMLRLRRFDPLVVFSEPGADTSVKLVAHWMRIKTKAGEVKLLVHE